MLNKTLCLLVLCTMIYAPAFGQTKVKRIFQDNKYDNRTNVIKETGENDYSILDEQFGDTKVGEVVRITIEKPKEQKPPRPPRPKVVKKKPVKEVEKLPKVNVEKEVFTAKGAETVAPAPRKRYRSASPSEFGFHKTYQAQLPKLKIWKKKKRRARKLKSRKSCYRFN